MGVVHLDDGVMVPSSCSLSVSMVEGLSGVVAPLAWGVGRLLMDSMRELKQTQNQNLLTSSLTHTLHLRNGRDMIKTFCMSFLP